MIPPPVFDNYIIPNIGGGIYFFSGLAADGEDTIVTLSTCSVKGKRFVVHGKLVG
ncbi:MAG: hypothetical protein HFI83_08770 [Eubacterium sp.]|nr:hypothetical protein [Eubacterium sp.]